ncbi:uncharacterized protein O3C94_008794 isoform 1-T4 [Discoglossus pictus]
MVMCGPCKKMLLTAILTLCSAFMACGFNVRGVERTSITLPCTYSVKKPGDLTTMCWGRGSCPGSKCNEPLIWTDGRKVTWRQSGRYELRGSLTKGDVSLTIHTASMEDQGTYCCRVEHHGWFNDKKLNMQLIMNKAPVTTRQNPVTTTTKPPPTTPLQTTVHIAVEREPEDPFSSVSTTTSDDARAPIIATHTVPVTASNFPTSFSMIDNMDTEQEPTDTFSPVSTTTSDDVRAPIIATHIVPVTAFTFPTSFSMIDNVDTEQEPTDIFSSVSTTTSDDVRAPIIATHTVPVTAFTFPTSFSMIDNKDKEQEPTDIFSPGRSTHISTIGAQLDTTSFLEDHTEVTLEEELDSREHASEAHTNPSEEEDSNTNVLTVTATSADARYPIASTEIRLAEMSSSLTSFSSPTPSTDGEVVVIKNQDTVKSGNAELQKKEVTIEESEKSGEIPLYVLVTAVSISVIVLVIISLLVFKLRRKDGGAYRFHYNPTLELVTHAENPMSEMEEEAIEVNQAKKEDGL